jgi:uncharacterized protein (DUF4415 family)
MGMDKISRPIRRGRQTKRAISLRVDLEILEWFKGGGPGYQTRMLTVLRQHVQSERSKSPPPEHT